MLSKYFVPFPKLRRQAAVFDEDMSISMVD